MQPQQPVPSSPPPPVAASPDKWICPQCNMHNMAKERKCFACDLVKPNDPELDRLAQAEKAKKDKLHQQAQDRVKYEMEGQGWVCQSCNGISGNDIFECIRCGGIRPYNTPEEKEAIIMYLKAKKARLLAETHAAANAADTLEPNPRTVPLTPTPRRYNPASTPTGSPNLGPMTSPNNNNNIITTNTTTGLAGVTVTNNASFAVLGSELSSVVVPAPHSGTLKMQNDGFLKTLKDRYCEIRGPYMYFYKVKDDSQLKGRILLHERGAEVVEDEPAKFRFHIHSATESKDYFFVDTNAASYTTWIAKLREAIATFANRTPGNFGLYKAEKGDFKELILFPSSDPLSKARYTLEDFEIMKLVGKGSFGKVLKVRNKVNNEIMAMKVLRKEAITKPKEVIAEKAVLQVVDHPFVVKLFGAWQTHSRLFLVMSYLPGGDMKLHLRRQAPFREDRARFYAAQMVLMLEHLHANRIVYRDLKPENLVLDAYGYLVLTDMGLARDMTEETQLKTFCGTPLYMAPELVDKKGYDHGVDWWAFGIILYEFLVGITPFAERTIQGVFNLLRTRDIHYPESMSVTARDLLSKVLVKDPKMRLTNANDVKAHPFFRDIDWKKMLERKLTAPSFIVNQESQSDSVMITPEQAKLLTRDDRNDFDELAVDPFLGFTFCDVKP